MALSPSLWDDLIPPEVWITLGTIDRPEADTFRLTVRLRESGRRSVSATAEVTRYAPTSSAVLAVSKAIEALAAVQRPITRQLLEQALLQAVRAWVDPF
jgi:hypothetical protein